jgi:hypothetical protein
MAECVWPDRAQDDAFITYRYARNLATGRGFVYNEGERVLGTTTPLYAMILAAGAAAGASIPEFSSALQIASAMALGGLILLHFRRIDRPGMGVAAMVFFALDRQALGQAIGMESALYAATIFGVFAALAGRRRALAALLCAPTTLLRPDGFLVYIALAVGLAGEKDREELLNDGKLFGALALSVATVGTWHALAWGYFGQPFPQSMAAKAAQSLEADRAKFLGRLFERFVFGPDGWRIRPLGLLALAGAADAVWRYPLTRPTFAWMACYIGLFSLAPDYAWYHFPLAAGVALAGGSWLDRRGKDFPKTPFACSDSAGRGSARGLVSREADAHFGPADGRVSPLSRGASERSFRLCPGRRLAPRKRSRERFRGSAGDRADWLALRASDRGLAGASLARDAGGSGPDAFNN